MKERYGGIKATAPSSLSRDLHCLCRRDPAEEPARGAQSPGSLRPPNREWCKARPGLPRLEIPSQGEVLGIPSGSVVLVWSSACPSLAE